MRIGLLVTQVNTASCHTQAALCITQLERQLHVPVSLRVAALHHASVAALQCWSCICIIRY